MIADLRAAVIADPDDDAARAVLGDALAEQGDPRGELYAVQLALADAGAPTARALARAPVDTADPAYARLAELLRRQAALLAALPPGHYERGGLAGVRLVDASRLAALLAREPITQLSLSGDAALAAAALAATPGIARITDLTLDLPDAAALADALPLLRALPRLAGLAIRGVDFDSAVLVECALLRSLDIRGIAPYHLDDLAVSPHARTLARLAIADPIQDTDALEALDGRFGNLEAFALRIGLGRQARIEAGRRRVFPPSVAIDIAGLPYAVGALLQDPGIARIRELSLDGLGAYAEVAIASIATACKQLVALSLTETRLTRAGISQLLALPAPLDRLAITHQLTITDFAPLVAHLRPRTLRLGTASDPDTVQRFARALDGVRDLAIDADLTEVRLASPALVRLAAFAPPADLAGLPNLAEVHMPS